jgi:16S rRNA (cytosine967-C5)-methyltransferase
VNIAAEGGEHPQSVRLIDSAPIRDLPGYAEGDFCVQDLASQKVASALNPRPGWTVLDLCAAPGGKTTHLAELMQNRGKIIACDIENDRLETLMALAKRLGITIVEPYRVDAKTDREVPTGPFDAVLVDAPCSNTGVLGRRPEVRWRVKPVDLEHLIRLQTRLMITAAERLKSGGVLVYSTCSIEPDENERLVKGVLRALPWLEQEAEEKQVPGQPADGGYWVRLRRKG